MRSHSKHNFIISIFIVICLLLSAVIVACAQPPATTPSQTQAPTTTAKPAGPKYGGILKMAEGLDGANIGYPAKQSPMWSWREVFPVVERLFRYDQSGAPVPYLASGVTTDANAKTVTITLNKGIKFHDGTDFNAAAVKWNLDTCMAAKVTGTDQYKSIEVVDDYTVRINLNSWDSMVVGNLAWIVGQMISPTAVQKNGPDWAGANPVGTGPFKFVSWQKDVKAIYTKFDGYWQKGKPYLDGIEYNIIADVNTRAMSLRAKEIDLGQSMGITKDLAQYEKDGLIVARLPSAGGAVSLALNSVTQNSPFADIKVRQAACYAVNGALIASGPLLGEGAAANQYDVKGSWSYNNSVVGYPYNLDKAKQLLAEAGYPNGFKTTLTVQINPTFTLILQAAQAQLKAAGIDAQVNPVTVPAYQGMVGEVGTAPGWDGMLSMTPRGSPDMLVVLSQIFGSKSTKLRGFTSRTIYPDDMSQAFDNAVAAPDFAGKQKWVQEWQKLSTDKYCLFIPVVVFNEVSVMQPYVKNSGILKNPFIAQWTPEEAWLDK
jgi:peptide/nickel transport system substrate-binding protein